MDGWMDVPLKDSFTILLIDRLRYSTLVTLNVDRLEISQFVLCHLFPRHTNELFNLICRLSS